MSHSKPVKPITKRKKQPPKEPAAKKPKASTAAVTSQKTNYTAVKTAAKPASAKTTAATNEVSQASKLSFDDDPFAFDEPGMSVVCSCYIVCYSLHIVTRMSIECLLLYHK